MTRWPNSQSERFGSVPFPLNAGHQSRRGRLLPGIDLAITVRVAPIASYRGQLENKSSVCRLKNAVRIRGFPMRTAIFYSS